MVAEGIRGHALDAIAHRRQESLLVIHEEAWNCANNRNDIRK